MPAARRRGVNKMNRRAADLGGIQGAEVVLGERQLLLGSLARPAIAEKLGVTKQTTDKHMDRIRSELHAENKVDAVVKAIRLGLI